MKSGEIMPALQEKPGKPLTIRHKSVSYSKWGYIFIAPFVITYVLWSLVPQLLTVYYSFFENYRSGLKQIGPNFVGLDNYIKLLTPDKAGEISILKYGGNTLLMWIMGAVPQFVIALLLAVLFTNYRLKLRGQGFFKTVIYLPNLIMASALSMLFFTLFNNNGPINQLMLANGWIEEAYLFFDLKSPLRWLVALMNFLLWFGNSTILLMAGIMGIDQDVFEAATIDGAKPLQVFFKITLPLLSPILVYTVITAMIGGVQMFDVPQILTKNGALAGRSAMTMVMLLNNYINPSKNYGMAGAVSVVLFVVSALLSSVVYRFLSKSYKSGERGL